MQNQTRKAELKQKLSNGNYSTFPVTKAVTTIGRSKSSDISVNDGSISRLHVRIENRNGTYFATDNNSSNGTFLNRRKITEAPLRDGDMLIAGRVVFFFSLKDAAPGSMETKVLPLSDQEQGLDNTQTMGLEGYPQQGDFSAETAPHRILGGPAAGSPAASESDYEEETLGNRPAYAPPPFAPPMAPPRPPSSRPTDRPMNSLGHDLAGDDGPTAEHRTAPTLRPAEPLHRLVAVLIDWLLGVLLVLPGLVLAFLSPTLGTVFNLLGSLAALAHFGIGWLKYGKTLGKHLMRIHIVDTNHPETRGLPISVALIRLLLYIVCWIPAGLLFLTIFMDKQGKGLHDRVANTMVVKD